MAHLQRASYRGECSSECFGWTRPRFAGMLLGLALIGLVLAGGPVTGAEPEPFRFVLEPASPGAAGLTLATLTIVVAPEHHLYRKQLSLEAAAGSLTVRWPDPEMKLDPFEGKEVAIYEAGSHQVGLTWSGTGGATGNTAQGVSSTTLTVGFQGCSSQTCFMPGEETFLLIPEPTPASQAAPANPAAVATAAPPLGTGGTSSASPPILPTGPGESATPTAPSPTRGSQGTPGGLYDFDETLRERGLLWALLIAFVGGFLVSLTPCVYPMIPITLSIIGGRQENTSFVRGLGLSLTYVLGMSFTYALLGVVVALFGSQIRGILQGPTFQLLMAVIFAILALSMFDLFLLQVPERFRQGITGIRKGGLGSVFLIGMLSGLMASPCIAAPLAGILAFIAASGSLLLGFTMLLSFAWGMGLILVLIGAFSGSLNALPRAGDWMIKVKEFYGFLLLGAAFYFAQPFIGRPGAELLAALLLAAFAGFLGLFSPISPEGGLGERVTRCFGVVGLAVACAFAVSAAATWSGIQLPGTGSGSPAGMAEPGGLAWHDRLEEALAIASREGKPVFLDFRADWCTICKELEADVFPAPAVARLLQRFVLARIDATTTTPETSELLRRFGVVGLPTLVILDAQGVEHPDRRVVGAITPAALALKLRNALR